MKLEIEKSTFMKSWQIAERATSSKSTINSLSGVLLKADKDSSAVTLESTDLKTSVKCNTQGIVIEEEGDTVLPVKIVGELFKKIPTQTFSLSISPTGRGTIVSGRNRYRFTTYPTDEFPHLPSSEAAGLFCDIKVSDLFRTLSEGTVAGSAGEEFPKYLGAAMFQVKDRELRIASTDSRRLSLSKCVVESEGEQSQVLLPLVSIKELHRIVSTMDQEAPLRILADNSLVYFQMPGIEFSARRIESTFPDYEKIINPENTTTMRIMREELLLALERVDVVVRDFSRMVIMKLSSEGDLHLTGRAPELGEAKEILDANIQGEPILIAFNVTYMVEGLKAFKGDEVYMTFNGPQGQMTMLRPEMEDFLYMLMPIKITDSDMESEDESEEEDKDEYENDREQPAE